MFSSPPPTRLGFTPQEFIRHGILQQMLQEEALLWAHKPSGRAFIIALAQKMLLELAELETSLAAFAEKRCTAQAVIAEMADVQELCALAKQTFSLQVSGNKGGITLSSAQTCWHLLANRECCQAELNLPKQQRKALLTALGLTKSAVAQQLRQLTQQGHSTFTPEHVVQEQSRKAANYGHHEGWFLSHVAIPANSLWVPYYRAKWPEISFEELNPATATTARQLGFA